MKERGIETSYIGSLTEGHRVLYQVDYTDANGSTTNVYFDSKTWLIYKSRRFIETSQGRAEIIKYYQDYRPVEGIVTPFRTESHFPPYEVDLHLINSMEINQPIDDDVFEFPRVPKLSTSELDSFVGLYQLNTNSSVEITRTGTALYVQLTNKPKVLAAIVDRNFIMFRDGIGDGSRMGNIFLKTDKSGNRYIELTLRRETFTSKAG